MLEARVRAWVGSLPVRCGFLKTHHTNRAPLMQSG
jgi:hypothetical protein